LDAKEDDQVDKQNIVTGTLLTIKRETGEGFVPAAIYGRHIHLDQKTADCLFGTGYLFTRYKELSQPGQYACEETVAVVGPKETLTVRVLGPLRREAQIEISITDASKSGVEPVVRMSGELKGSPGARIIGPAGETTLQSGVIVAARHLHMSKAQADGYGLKNGDTVDLRSDGCRGIVFERVVVRSGMGHELELHIDFDEANCAQIKTGDLLKIVCSR